MFDLLKVRRLVDEAADLAVRAQNGTASSALIAENGLPGAALGFNARGGGGNAKLSPERKHRMRELATAKLSQAYRLDEVAASVATMQSASALDSVANTVLQRAPTNTDAQYVNFFHEKIPSRMMAECTSLDPLDHIIARGSGHAAAYRTRALTKIFKEDFMGAAQDLTEALTICHAEQARHVSGKNQLISMKQAQEDAAKRRIWSKDWMSENRVLEEDQPKGLEMQLLFQRGNQYLTIAFAHLKRALAAFKNTENSRTGSMGAIASVNGHHADGSSPNSTLRDSADEYRQGLEARELVRKYAKRALRDYTTFFAHLDYATASDPQVANVFDRGKVLGEEMDGSNGLANGNSAPSNSSQALIRRTSSTDEDLQDHKNIYADAEIKTYSISKLLSSSPPTDIPAFPHGLLPTFAGKNQTKATVSSSPHSHEMLTYHPLLPETIHSFLLTHCLLQTAPTTFQRIANNAARLSRLADGYPFFLSARSPARADWAEVLRQTKNWIGLAGTWDQLCKVDTPQDKGSPHRSSSNRNTNGLAGQDLTLPNRKPPKSKESNEQQRDRIHKEAVMKALGDERVVDDESFQKAVKARETRAIREIKPNAVTNGECKPHANGVTSQSEPETTASPLQSSAEPFGRGRGPNGPGSSVAKDEEYLIGTERAECIAKWIMEAPQNPMPLEGTNSKPKKKKKPIHRKPGLSQQPSDTSTMTDTTQPD